METQTNVDATEMWFAFGTVGCELSTYSHAVYTATLRTVCIGWDPCEDLVGLFLCTQLWPQGV